MKAVVLATVVATGFLFACATGTYAPADSTTHGGKDGGILSKGDSGSSSNDNNNNPPPSGDDGGTTNTNTCSGTLCGTDCVDTSSDPNNCGACANACDVTATCTGGQCVPSSTNTTNEPPQGTCSHSLCTSGNSLDEACDAPGCTIVICDPTYLGDNYCCDTSWDSTCIDEVNTYCAPYSCN